MKPVFILPSLLGMALLAGCYDHDPIKGDACKIAMTHQLRQNLADMLAASEDCSLYPAIRERAIACSNPDYIDATAAYAMKAVRTCGSWADIQEAYKFRPEARGYEQPEFDSEDDEGTSD